MTLDPALMSLLGGILTLLMGVAAAGWIGRRRAATEVSREFWQDLQARILTWWVLLTVLALALLVRPGGAILLFGLLSFLALREFITLTPTRRADHRTLFWVFFVLTPLQYVLVWARFYAGFVLLIPVCAFLFVPLRSALAGDGTRFLERTAKIQWALMVCVFCVSHAPALLMLEIPGYAGRNATLLLYFILIVKWSDIFQFIWSRAVTPPAAGVAKGWRSARIGVMGGVLTASGLGTVLWWATPFTPGQAALISLGVTLMGVAGVRVMAAIRSDLGIRTYGSLVEGQGGVLDRIDSICFAAPVFFYVVRFCFTEAGR